MMSSTEAKRQAVTLRDVAEATGVSISTVSRVLDSRSTSSRSATAVRVRQIAEELGYRRNMSASGLRRGSTGTIGVVVPRLSDTVMAMVFEALERAARSHGHFAVVATSGDDPADERTAAETLLDRNVDGLILASARLDDQLPASLRERHVPHALVVRTDGTSPSALGDDETGGYLAVRHLIDLGHTDIAVVTGPDFASTARDRLAGARRALIEAGLDLPADRIIGRGYRIENGAEAGGTLFSRPSKERVTAVFAANDNLALGIIAAAQRAGVSIGSDVALVGYNDIPLAQLLPVPLTSVKVPFDQIAESALRMLLAPETQPGHVTRALPTLMPRASSGPPRR
jgi:LacI family transcriptional regulator